MSLAGIGDNSGGLDIAAQIKENLTEKHPDVIKRAAELVGMLERAPKVAEDEDTANKVSEAIRQCTAFEKAAGTTRVAEKEPYLEGGRAVDGFFNTMIGDVGKTKAALLRVRTAYDMQIEAEARQRRQEEARLAQIEADRLAAKAKTDAQKDKAEIAQVVAEEAHQATKVSAADLTRTRTDTGVTTSLRKEWRHEVVEEKKVPRKYCHSDDKLLKAAVKSAVTADGQCPLEISGVRIYEHRFSQVR